VPSIHQLAALAKTAAIDAGFDLVGIAPADGAPELDYFAQWIAQGRHGDMRYMESRDDAGHLKRSGLRFAAPWAKSVIVCAMKYNTAQPYSTQCHDPSHGWISRYAWGQRDYHDILLPRLREVESRLRESAGDIRTWCYVDTGPVVERVLARYAGIGWIGKNACIINQQLGSWLFLGVILTSLELQPDLPAPDRCGTCTRCIQACPTEAFLAPGKLDASRCISYLTIEKRSAVPEDLRIGMGRHVFGCDICQDVCPWNNRGGRDASVGEKPEFQPRHGLVNPDLQWLANISEEEFREAFRGSPIKRAKRSGLRRNAVIAMGNSGNPQFASILRNIAEHDPDDVVAEHARWALRRIAELQSENSRTSTGVSYAAE
jgi:epoxyqueuosine reductase